MTNVLVGGAVLATLAAIALWATVIAAWVTHVVICIQSASWVLLAFGCIVAPVGVIHGAGAWFGVWA